MSVQTIDLRLQAAPGRWPLLSAAATRPKSLWQRLCATLCPTTEDKENLRDFGVNVMGHEGPVLRLPICTDPETMAYLARALHGREVELSDHVELVIQCPAGYYD